MRILITGAARAIGYATAVELADRGHDVVATARNSSSITPHPGIEVLTLDVTDADSVATCVAAAGDIQALVNNAAIGGAGPIEDFPIDRLQDMIETNLLGSLRMVQALTPGFRTRGNGVIVNVSSVQGKVVLPLEAPYSITKFALEALSEALHLELRHFGIRTVVVQPGFVSPGMKPTEQHAGPPEYEDLWSQRDGLDAVVTGGAGRTSPEFAASVIADAVENDSTPLRVRIGPDAELALDARKSATDEQFEAALRSTMGLTW